MIGTDLTDDFDPFAGREQTPEAALAVFRDVLDDLDMNHPRLAVQLKALGDRRKVRRGPAGRPADRSGEARVSGETQVTRELR